MPERLPYAVEPMTLADIDQVMEIEQVAFPTPWSARAYRYEITENKQSTLLVVRTAPVTAGRFGQLARRLGLFPPVPVLGYAGFWFLVDEAHIYTIAVHPQWRGKGLGELLMLALMDRSVELGADRATLEVRISNRVAQELYSKFGFEIVSRRKGYYSDNNEDAYIMTTPSFQHLEFRASLDYWRSQLYARLRAEDANTQTLKQIEPQTESWLDKKPHMR